MSPFLRFIFFTVVLYFLARFIGKYIGAFAAMSLADVPAKVRNYLGLALLPHGGVAVGLILFVQADSRFSDIAATVTTVGLAALAMALQEAGRADDAIAALQRSLERSQTLL